MERRQLSGLMLASALITFDGTATTVALPVIGKSFSASVFSLQWVSNAPLLVLAALLLPAGLMADRFGRVRVIRIGLATFSAGAALSVAASSVGLLITARLLLGLGGALILPATLALLRASADEADERTRIFGLWAAWTGVAAALGPLVAGVLVDLLTWRAIFALSAAAGLASLPLVRSQTLPASTPRQHPVPFVASAALVLLLGAAAYALMAFAGGAGEWTQLALPCTVAIAAVVPLVRDPRSHQLVPRELLRARNCMPANAASFALYFGMFGLSFLVALYTQQVLGYGALRAAVVLLPISVMLFFAEAFGRLSSRFGTRTLIIAGTLCAAAGIYWIASGPHPLAFWSRLLVGTALHGLGLSLAVSALTHAAVAAVPETCAGAASGLNHAVVRVAGLLAIAVLGSAAAPGSSAAVSPDGFQAAMYGCAAVVAIGGVLGCVFLRDDAPGGVKGEE